MQSVIYKAQRASILDRLHVKLSLQATGYLLKIQISILPRCEQ